MIVSPSAWPTGLTARIYTASPDKPWAGQVTSRGILQFKALFDNKNGVHHQFDNLAGFNHKSSPTVGFGLGLNFCFDQWEWAGVAEEQNKRIKFLPDFSAMMH